MRNQKERLALALLLMLSLPITALAQPAVESWVQRYGAAVDSLNQARKIVTDTDAQCPRSDTTPAASRIRTWATIQSHQLTGSYTSHCGPCNALQREKDN